MTCPATNIVNKTKTWTEYDQKTVDNAKSVCYLRYSACLKVFYKTKELTYRAVCKKESGK